MVVEVVVVFDDQDVCCGVLFVIELGGGEVVDVVVDYYQVVFFFDWQVVDIEGFFFLVYLVCDFEGVWMVIVQVGECGWIVVVVGGGVEDFGGGQVCGDGQGYVVQEVVVGDGYGKFFVRQWVVWGSYVYRLLL